MSSCSLAVAAFIPVGWDLREVLADLAALVSVGALCCFGACFNQMSVSQS